VVKQQKKKRGHGPKDAVRPPPPEKNLPLQHGDHVGDEVIGIGKGVGGGGGGGGGVGGGGGGGGGQMLGREL